jgi:hypothetical protein
MIDLLATTTCWDVIDDAVKIGLGALIGGGFAWLLAKQKYSQDVNKEDRKYSQEIAKEDRAHRKAALEQLAVEFEQIHEDIWVHALPGIDKLHSGFQKLHAIEAKLMLFKLNPCAEVIDKYRLDVSNVITVGSTMSLPEFEAKLAESRDSAAAKRVEFFKQMAAAYS